MVLLNVLQNVDSIPDQERKNTEKEETQLPESHLGKDGRLAALCSVHGGFGLEKTSCLGNL